MYYTKLCDTVNFLVQKFLLLVIKLLHYCVNMKDNYVMQITLTHTHVCSYAHGFVCYNLCDLYCVHSDPNPGSHAYGNFGGRPYPLED